ncbi:hypothetical protein CLOM_g12101 [Closterium sp. NIES-68]|nr:hypothetical protein CLOM_g12101 [Closterium sp. NIES-68]GJP58028.1 hypothetical protein CLOP_g20101 [Closterium sp. NIES-67]
MPHTKASNSTGKFYVDVNITESKQTTNFIFFVYNVPPTPKPTFSNPTYYTTDGKLLIEFTCAFKAIGTPGSYYCGLAGAAAKVAEPYKPIGKGKKLVDAGLFTNPGGFYASIKVNGVELRGGITASVANL